MHPTSSRSDRRRLLGLLLGLGAPALGCAAMSSGTAPDFTLRSADGRHLRLQELRGQVVMVNFWATWCAPCRVEMPHLEKLYARYRSSGFVLLGVNVDDEPGKAIALARQLDLSFPVLLDAEKKVSRLYDVSTMPSTWLIDRDGRLRHAHRGYRDGMETTYEQQLRALLKE